MENPDVTDLERQRAYLILCKVSLALQKPEMAKKYLMKILELDPTYQPTIEEETPQFVNFVAQVRKEYIRPVKKTDRKGLLKWMAVGAGAIITVTVVAVMASGTDKPEEKIDVADHLCGVGHDIRDVSCRGDLLVAGLREAEQVRHPGAAHAQAAFAGFGVAELTERNCV